ncbi:MAG: DNA topoisomerase, partial [Rhodothermales bacterium]
PFTTSTLQQEANRKLSLSARQTMQTAQRLYENGFITYMRTDSTTLSREAIEGSRRAVEERYGNQYLSPKPRQYQSKVANAQEAHEAIRPAGREMRTRDEHALTGVEGALYDLIWKRTVASQMADARIRAITVHIDAAAGAGGPARFRASGRTIEFPGFFRAYVEGSDDPDAALEDRDQPLPGLKEGDEPACRNVEASGHETKPPARYTEATLVRVLEQEGIGRPSTYATIIDTIIQRGYVRKQGSQLAPTFTAFAANNLLEEQFEQLVDVRFTAEMEQVLDDIAMGERDATPYLKSFFLGPEGLEAMAEVGLDKIDARKVSTIESPKWNGYVVRVGKYGPYVEGEIDGERATASLPDEFAPADVTMEKLKELLESGNADDRLLGPHPETGDPIVVRKGPYGPYVQLGEEDKKTKPKRVSLPKGIEAEEVDLQTAIDLLGLPRTLGEHPETGKPIKANIGRYGPYVQHESVFASLKAEDDVLSVDLDRALELLSEKSTKTAALRTVGNHPETGEPVEIWKGRFGPYVKHQKTNASLPKGTEPEDISLEEAVKLLQEREKTGKKGKGRKTRKTK